MKVAIALFPMLPLAAVLLVASPVAAPLEIGAGERLLVIAPHPDDETLGAGGLVQRVLARGGSARVVILTAGDGYPDAVARETGNREPRPADFVAYGRRRMGEARAAVRELGGGRVHLQFLGFPDGGLAPLLHAHWRRSHPERSATTGASDPPYPEVVEPNVAYDGDDLLREIAEILRDTAPTVIALPDPADAHPDHSATGLFALLALEAQSRAPASHGPPLPRIFLYLVHWRAWPEGFTSPTPPGPDTPLELPEGLPEPGLPRVALLLSDFERGAKAAALARHGSQQEIMGSFLRAFVRRTEPFRVLATPALDQIAIAVERSLGLAQALHRAAEAPRADDVGALGASSRRDLPAPPGRPQSRLLGARGADSPVLQ